MAARPTLLVFAKPPRIGVSKTRLAKGLNSPVEARRIASMSLARTLRAARLGAWTPRLYLDPPTAGLGGIERGFEIFGQGRGDLTDKLDKGLAEAPPGPVIFIGADAPDLTPAQLRAAVRALQGNDAVFGPASDGGFWLFGLNTSARTPSPFGSVRWSTEHALADVKANLPAGARIAMLDELVDLDTAGDVADWKSKQAEATADLADTSSAKPETPIVDEQPKQKKPGFFARLFGRKAA